MTENKTWEMEDQEIFWITMSGDKQVNSKEMLNKVGDMMDRSENESK